MVSFSGCIDIDLAKGLMREDEKPTGFQTVTKIGFPVKHEFDLLEQDYQYQKSHPIFIKKNTGWMNITFSVRINDIEFINFTNQSLRDLILEALNLVHRHVEITLIDPNGDEVVKEDYEETIELQTFTDIEEPLAGTWKISINAIGGGYPGQFQDSFMVDVICYEPT
jgi:hypothetical protein